MGATVASDRRADFGKAMALLAVSLGFELDEPTIGVYWHALRAIPVELRREAFAVAAEQPWRRLPQPGELKAIAAGVQRAKRKAAADRHLADCPHSSHWLYNERGAVTGRCPCWKAAQAAMAAVGEALALPAVAGEESES